MMASDYCCDSCSDCFESQKALSGHESAAHNPSLRISRDDLISELERLAAELGKPPSSAEMDDVGGFSVTPYQREFGTWSEAKEAAGIESSKEIATSSLLEELHRLERKLGHTPTTREMEHLGKFSISTYLYRFGTWKRAVEQIGRNPSQLNKVNPDLLLEDLANVGEELGHSPTILEYRNKGEFGSHTFYRHFGSWPDALQEAGLEPTGYTQTGSDHPLWKENKRTNYGESWTEEKRESIRNKYGRTCVGCGLPGQQHREEFNERLHVHHIIPARKVKIENHRNSSSNLIPLCNSCHRRWEGIPLRPTLIDGD